MHNEYQAIQNHQPPQSTTGHAKAVLPVRSATLKPCAGRLVVGWVTTSEYLLLIVFFFFVSLFFWFGWWGFGFWEEGRGNGWLDA
jgi:hypothetical protein